MTSWSPGWACHLVRGLVATLLTSSSLVAVKSCLATYTALAAILAPTRRRGGLYRRGLWKWDVIHRWIEASITTIFGIDCTMYSVIGGT